MMELNLEHGEVGCNEDEISEDPDSAECPAVIRQMLCDDDALNYMPYTIETCNSN